MFVMKNNLNKYIVYEVDGFGKTNIVKNIGSFDSFADCYLHTNESKDIYIIDKWVGGDKKSQLRIISQNETPVKSPCTEYIFDDYKIDNRYYSGFFCQKEDKLEFTKLYPESYYFKIIKKEKIIFKEIKLLQNKKVLKIELGFENSDNENNSHNNWKFIFEDGSKQVFLSDAQVENLYN